MTKLARTLLLVALAGIMIAVFAPRAGRFSPKPEDLKPNERLVKITTTWVNLGQVTGGQVNIDVGSQGDSGRRRTPYTKTFVASPGDAIDVNVSIDPARALQITCEAWVTSKYGGTHRAPLVKVYIIPQAQIQCTGQVT